MSILTNREWASVIIAIAFVCLLLLWPQTRAVFKKDLPDLLRQLFAPKLLVPFVLYFAFVAGVMLAAERIGVWSLGLLKDSVIITVFVGIPMLFKIPSLNDEVDFVRDVARDPLRISALLVFYLNLAPLALWAEVCVQAVLVFLGLLRAVSAPQAQLRPVRRVLDVLISVIVIWLVVDTTLRFVGMWHELDLGEVRDSFLLSIWLPLVIAVFIYGLALYAAFEQIVRMLPFANEQQPPKRGVVWALVLGSHLRTANTSAVVGKYRYELAQARGFRDGLRVMRAARTARVEEGRERRAVSRRLRRFAGVAGMDAAGLQLDRREFAATKKALTSLFYMEMGQNRNRLGHYRGDMVGALSGFNLQGLPAEHGIEEVVRKDRQAWRAWRQTPSGYYFGVGGTKDLHAQWQYDGPTPPSGFPGADARWRNATASPSSPEWEQHDLLLDDN